jgi:hypothetical protein
MISFPMSVWAVAASVVQPVPETELDRITLEQHVGRPLVANLQRPCAVAALQTAIGLTATPREV